MNKAVFEWPTPNYFKFTQDRDVNESETCLIYRRDGTKVLGELIDEKLASKAEVDAALSHQQQLRRRKIGDYLAQHQIISIEQLDNAIKYQENQPILNWAKPYSS